MGLADRNHAVVTLGTCCPMRGAEEKVNLDALMLHTPKQNTLCGKCIMSL